MNVTTTTSNVTTETPLEDFPAYQVSLLLPKVVLPVLVVLGVTGNVLTLVTVHSPAYGRSTTAAAISLLAGADTGYLLANLRWWSLVVFAADFRLVSPAACRFHQMWTYFFRHLSSCTLAFITVERMVAVCFPIRWKTTFTTKKNAIFLVVLVLVLFGINLQLPFKFTILPDIKYKTNVLECNVYYEADSWFNYVWKPLDQVLHSFLPTAIILTGNVVIIWRLRTMPDLSGENEDRNRSITVMLVAVSIVFLLTTMPGAIFNICDGYGLWPDNTNRRLANVILAHTFFTIWSRINNAVNFLLYSVTGTKFRKAFLKTFRCKSGKSKAKQTKSGDSASGGSKVVSRNTTQSSL